MKPNFQTLQRLVKTLMKGGKTPERAVLMVVRAYGLSMAAMEILHYSVTK